MRRHSSVAIIGLALVALLAPALAACTGALPAPPVLALTSPERGLVQNGGHVVVRGTTQPSPDGDPVTKVTVNQVPAVLAADGTFTAVLDLPGGAVLLETIAYTAAGGQATDARSVHVGELRPVGTRIDKAVTAALSADAFARLSAAAGPIIEGLDLSALLAPLQPMADLGDNLAHVKVAVTDLALGHVTVKLTPMDGGLAFAATLDGLKVGATATYGGVLVPAGTTTIGVSAASVTIAGTLVVTPAGTSGFTTTVAAPTVQITQLKLNASGLAGRILELLTSNLEATISRVAARTSERALAPLLNTALGALAGPKRVAVLGAMLDLQASPAAVVFTRAGALVTMNLQATIEGSESSPGFIYVPNGTPTIDVSHGVQLGLADDLVNEMLAEIHAMGLLDIHLQHDYGVFDTIDLKLAMPPMISASTTDGALHLLLGDMIATVSAHGQPLVTAAVNAQADLSILRGSTPQEIALQFGAIHLWVNLISDTIGGEGGSEAGGEYDLTGAAAAGIELQLDSLRQFLVTVPLPAVAGVSFDSMAVRADSGYVVLSGELH